MAEKDYERAKRLNEVYKHLFMHYGIESQTAMADFLKVLQHLIIRRSRNIFPVVDAYKVSDGVSEQHMSRPSGIGDREVIMQRKNIIIFFFCRLFPVPEGEAFRLCIGKESFGNVPASAVNKGMARQIPVPDPVDQALYRVVGIFPDIARERLDFREVLSLVVCGDFHLDQKDV